MRAISRGQLLEWMVWAKIRGPVGPVRRDHYVYYLALHGGRQYDDKATVEGLAVKYPLAWHEVDPDRK